MIECVRCVIAVCDARRELQNDCKTVVFEKEKGGKEVKPETQQMILKILAYS